MRRDRHGRETHADTDERRRPPPGFRVRDARRFAGLVEEAVGALPARLAAALADADLLVDEVPAADALVDEAGEVTLARFEPATRRSAPRLVVHRRPLEHRAGDRDDLVDLVRLAVGHAVARALGIDDDLDDLWDDED